MASEQSRSAKFQQIYDSLPPSAQQALVEQHLLPLLNHVPRERARKVLTGARRAQARATKVPTLDIRAKKNEVNDLLDELERDAKRSFVRDRSNKEEILSEVVNSLVEWLNKVWSVAYEHKTNFAQAHGCLLFAADVLDHIANSRGGCKCSFTNMFVPITIKTRKGRLVRAFELNGAHQIENVLLWIWRDMFLTMLALNKPRVAKAIPEMLADIELILGWPAVEKVLYGGKRMFDGDEEDEDEEDDEYGFDCQDFGSDSEFDSEDEDEEGPCGCPYHADHWPRHINAQIVPLRTLVRTHLTKVFSTVPSARLFKCLTGIAEYYKHAEGQLLAILRPLQSTSSEAAAAALDIYALQDRPVDIAAHLDANAALLRPRDARSLQAAALAMALSPAHSARALALLERELRDAAQAIRGALRGAFCHLGDAAAADEVQQILRLRAGSAARAERVTAYVDAVVTPGAPTNPMALAAMMMGFPLGAALADEMSEQDPMGYLDVDRDDPDLEDLREEFRPRLKERFEGWVDTGMALGLGGGPAVLMKIYKELIETMPFLRGQDIVDEMIGRLADRPSKHYICDALDGLAVFVKTQRKRAQIRAEKKRKTTSSAPPAFGPSSAGPDGEDDPPPLIPITRSDFGGMNDVD
ncbi:hypothetical protein PUNSTDRAFT_93003 [Punctularia strigosozonata HHB-11173 SS5]|uniref:Uncharacterized protein n=1 Tax=Punctularia strigosozonata (strain HHB-11173) TaxID=741275 RepID=R7S372_PUNST|nr:uncharacterized protein PUNSTDRAFT_93003 [Punctularia strigosozonata HHB-11173 SS5]EIN04289.1 hypothetical protein PUNSTDRAFT_93003 [Punctularia strigosozonata HHB-11173 SS5]